MCKGRKYYCIVVMIVVLLYACSGDVSTPGELIFPTGNHDFTIEEAQHADPLDGYRNDEGDSNTLPSSLDHSDQMPMVRSQGGTSSCTSWAVGYYGKTFQEVQEEGWNPDNNAFSPSYLYAMQCRTYQRPWSIVKALEILQRNGVAKWGSLPFEDLSEPGNLYGEKENYANLGIPIEAHEEAKIYRCGEVANARSLGEIKYALTQGPVVLAINQYDSPPANPSPEENYMRYNPDKTNVGHAILCVGYDNHKFGGGALKFVNSWGSGWGEYGYSWIRYSDISNIVRYAMNFKDIPNPNTPDDPPDVESRPDPPSDVSASDDAGNFVDIAWSRVSGAQYYRVYRREVTDDQTYTEIGISYQSRYRDQPTPGIDYYYSIASVNDLGESDHHPSDTDSEDHVDIGSAIGGVLDTPTLQWEKNDSDGSHFLVDNIDPAATSMEVLISTASAGPWSSLGWIKPDDFTIKWGDDSPYANQQPFVRVRVANAEASSELSAPAQVEDNLDNDVEVCRITTYVVTPQTDRILLRWTTDGGNIDFFEIWRYNASNDTANEWIKIGYTDTALPDENSFINFEDKTPLPGVPYYYAIVPVFRGTYGESAYTDDAYKIEDSGTNLRLTYFSYYYGQITSPTEFPEVIVRNDGSARVDSYTIGILVYDWDDGQTYVLETRKVDVPLEGGYQHTLHLAEVAIPNTYADGHAYSWGLKVDQDQEIGETYEDDNVLWSNDGWFLAQNGATAKDQPEVKKDGPRLGNTLPFSRPMDTEDLIYNQMANDELPLLIYDGPSLHYRPDLSNDHAK